MNGEYFETLIQIVRYLKSSGNTYASLSKMSREELKIQLELHVFCSIEDKNVRCSINDKLIDQVLAVFEVFSK